MTNIKKRLDDEVVKRNSLSELSEDRPDPLMIAKKYNSEYVALICALFAYGNATQIVKLLSSFNFELLDESEDVVKRELQNHYYRFQTSKDIADFFVAMSKVKKENSLKDIFYEEYKKDNSTLEGIAKMINEIKRVTNRALHVEESHGYKFLLSDEPKRSKDGKIKHIGNSPYKRWNMFLRWMVREDELDMGLWSDKIETKDLILPLDTHTFKVSQKLGLLTRKTYDLKSAILITEKLKEFDANDPIKYDFALYRIGQERIL